MSSRSSIVRLVEASALAHTGNALGSVGASRAPSNGGGCDRLRLPRSIPLWSETALSRRSHVSPRLEQFRQDGRSSPHWKETSVDLFLGPSSLRSHLDFSPFAVSAATPGLDVGPKEFLSSWHSDCHFGCDFPFFTDQEFCPNLSWHQWI